MPQTVGAEEQEEQRYDIDGNDVIMHSTKAYSVEDTDPFNKTAIEVKELKGVDPGKKRSITHMQKRYQGKDGAKSKKIETDVITGYNAFEVVAPPYNLDYLAKLYEMSTPHYAAVNAKVSNIVGLGYDFIPSLRTKEKIDGMTKEKKAKYEKKLTSWKNDLIELVDELNEEDTFSEVLQKVWRDYEATGNGYIEIGRSETTGKIGYVGHVPSATVRVRRQRDGFVQIISNKAVFFRNFGKDDPDPIGKDSNPSELIHIKKYAPSSTFYGIPDIIPAKTAVAGLKFAADFNLDYFENKAVPRHVIILKGATINPRLAKNILEFFETGLKGKNHRSLFIPLPASTSDKQVDLKIDPVEAGIQDSSFKNYNRSNKDEVFMAHRVPVSKAGLPEGISLAAARDADKTFKEQVCNPEQRMMEKKVGKIFKDLQGAQYLFDFKLNELTLTDENTQSQIDERRIKTGVETPNEQRTRRGLPALPDGDKRVDLNAKANAGNNSLANDARAEGNRERDAQRSAGATDSIGEGRNAKGEGRTSS